KLPYCVPIEWLLSIKERMAAPAEEDPAVRPLLVNTPPVTSRILREQVIPQKQLSKCALIVRNTPPPVAAMPAAEELPLNPANLTSSMISSRLGSRITRPEDVLPAPI